MMQEELSSWATDNPVRPEMLWKGAATRQIKKFDQMKDLGSLSVVETHKSKSIDLPVVKIQTENGYFLLRDNFYTVDVCIIWGFAPDIKLSDVYKSNDYTWYLEEMQRKREYSYKGWSETEMADPRILRVQVESLSGTPYWSKVSGEDKDRWSRRYEDTSWYGKDWSSTRLIVDGTRQPNGLLGPQNLFYCAPRAFAEGINRYVEKIGHYNALQHFEPGRKEFTLACDGYDEARALMECIIAADPTAD